MHPTITTVLLGAAAASSVFAASGNGVTTRYWDCCKPSCSWSGKAPVSAPVLTCDASDNPLADPDVKSGCDGGSAYTCSNFSPWAVDDNLAYGFAATAIGGGSESSWCCACYQLEFTSGPAAGKTMIVQSTNTGGDLNAGSNHFDILMPGGGVGIFDGCASEFGHSLPGQQYGGVAGRDEFTQVQCPAELTAISGCVRDDDGEFPAALGV
ncbi:glycoside hydrolase family 45 protein [Astrocystis sublimbata]|nr:glycoside hydrolase family 45 protein [Astrocystis sublimbata]